MKPITDFADTITKDEDQKQFDCCRWSKHIDENFLDLPRKLLIRRYNKL